LNFILKTHKEEYELFEQANAAKSIDQLCKIFDLEE